jgi:hypothetical protein
MAARLGLAPRSFRLTGEQITLILPSNKVVGHPGIAPGYLLVPSEADFFLPHARWPRALIPNLFRFSLFSRQAWRGSPVHHP